ncbi:MAG: polysaccharide export protein [Firmicutes bacterium]|nr:polysaccharide export protein [Bacillota bacterium]
MGDVWGTKDVKPEPLLIGPDGYIYFPLVGEVQAEGLSVAELTDRLIEGLSQYIRHPKVTVNLAKLRTTRVYVLGEVQKPGLYELEKDHHLLDAVGIAGSYTKDAAKKKVFVIRKNSTSAPLRVNLLALMQKGDMSQNVLLNEGDVVYLTANNRIDFSRDILPFVTGAYYINHFEN